MFAVFYRMAGGFIGIGSTTLTRLRWAFPVGLLMGFAVFVHQRCWLQAAIVAALCTVTAFIGRLIPHARFQVGVSFVNMIGMSVVGALRLALILLPYVVVATDGWYMMIIATVGALQGLAYFIGYQLLDQKDSGFYYDNTSQDSIDLFAKSGPEWGEVLTGLMVYQFAYALVLVIP